MIHTATASVPEVPLARLQISLRAVERWQLYQCLRSWIFFGLQSSWDSRSEGVPLLCTGNTGSPSALNPLYSSAYYDHNLYLTCESVSGYQIRLRHDTVSLILPPSSHAMKAFVSFGGPSFRFRFIDSAW